MSARMSRGLRFFFTGSCPPSEDVTLFIGSRRTNTESPFSPMNFTPFMNLLQRCTSMSPYV